MVIGKPRSSTYPITNLPIYSFSLSPLARKADRDVGFHFYWIIIQQIGTILPLAHGFQGSIGEQRRTADHVQALNAAVPGNDRVQLYITLYPCSKNQPRINRNHFVYQHPFRKMRNFYALLLVLRFQQGKNMTTSRRDCRSSAVAGAR